MGASATVNAHRQLQLALVERTTLLPRLFNWNKYQSLGGRATKEETKGFGAGEKDKTHK